MRTVLFLSILGFSLAAGAADPKPATPSQNSPYYVEKASWPETMIASRAALKAAALPADQFKTAQATLWREIEGDFPVQWDWMLQDYGLDAHNWFGADGKTEFEKKMIGHVLEELGAAGAGCKSEFDQLAQSNASADDVRWLTLYVKSCEQRRAVRLKPLLAKAPKIVFTKHQTIRPSFFAYTEGQSDAQAERHFLPGSSLCLLEMDGIYGKVKTLLDDPTGAIRDPSVSYDAQRILFGWKKSLNEDDYHLYEMNVASGQMRQITFGLGFADYEPSYLPNDDIVFSSSRCVQTVDCWVTEVSNLYSCDKDGRFLRRLGFDQVHTVYPTVTDDGRVLYTRWDYNDRGQMFPQPLFQMNPDGTAQQAVYGINSWFPTTIDHARGIPGTQKAVAIFTGHHSPQTGKLGIIDPSKGREENTGAQLIAPVRETKAERIDGYGQDGELFQYPYPLSETEFVVTYSPLGWRKEGDPKKKQRKLPADFGIYFMTIDGRRELLASDPHNPCNQPFPLVARTKPLTRPSVVDYHKNTGTYYMQNVYFGPGLEGVPKGTIKRLRVIGLDFRAAVVGGNSSGGPGGGAFISTPIAVGNGSWDVKVIIGDADVYEDGSAFFTVPARTPLYFQALDEKGRAVQTMRSWSTLQPGENQSCVGCHESKNTVPPQGYANTQALKAGPQTLKPFYGPPRGFSFIKEVQPILDRKCISCHNDRNAKPAGSHQAEAADLSHATVLSPIETEWQFTTQRPKADWIEPGFDSSAWKKGLAGFGTKGTPGGKCQTDWKSDDIWLRRQFTLPESTQCGPLYFNVVHDEDVEIYLNGKLAAKEAGFITKFATLAVNAEAAALLKPGVNTLAVHCHQTTGGQLIDVGLVTVPKPEPVVAATGGKASAFSLLGADVTDPGAKRKWSDAYLALTQAHPDERPKDPSQCCSKYRGKTEGRLVNWIGSQSVVTMLPPYFAGSTKSELVSMLEKGHKNVSLTREEMDKIACWIDLLVPYAGDYREGNAWNEEEMRKYDRYYDKRKRMESIDRANIADLIAKQSGEYRETPVSVQLLDAAGKVVGKEESTSRTAFLTVEREYQPGDKIVATGSTHLVVRLDGAMTESLVYTANGRAEFVIPTGKERGAYSPESFAGRKHTISVRPASREEVSTYRNLALNSCDLRGETAVFPHATSNSECRNEGVFAARNAIDGQAANTKHGGWPNQSWGPDKRTDLWWKVDFGRPVELDKLVLYVRADFPHDGIWQTATIEFSDGSHEAITINKTAEKQQFTFASRKVTWARLTNLVQPEPLQWCAFTEVEFWGREVGGQLASK